MDTSDSVDSSALPSAWDSHWGDADTSVRLDLKRIRRQSEELAEGLAVVDRRKELGPLVGSADLRSHPVHRWFFYKEGFSPALAPLIASELGLGTSGVVVDSFAGVGTGPLSLRPLEQVTAVIGVEYSPFAQFASQVKLGARALDRGELKSQIARLEKTLSRSRRAVDLPELSSFHSSDMFDDGVAEELVRAIELVQEYGGPDDAHRDFLRLGIAAVVEDASNAMKDGRALRLLKGRRRAPKALVPVAGGRSGVSVADRVINQWRAMAEDLEAASPQSMASTQVVRGDALDLSALLRDAIGSDNEVAALHVFSPPYLNCLDYSEVYKLELWLLGFVRSRESFRSLREGTLRSHPSVKFPDRADADWGREGVFGHINSVTAFLEEHLPRRPVGTMVGQYFKDMNTVLRSQIRSLEPGGHLACVVANSTFSGRSQAGGQRSEAWRLPVLTDVVIARLAEAAGARPVAIWDARALRPRNATSGAARESVVVCRKDDS